MRSSLVVLALSVAPAVAGADTITTVDSGGVGQYTSVVYGSDGLPLIAYYDVANADLKVAHCLDVACTASTKRTVDGTGDVGKHASVAIGSNGLGLISYLDATNARIKVARCTDLACTASSTVTLTSAGPAAEGADIAVPADGRPVLAFRDGTALRVARCTDAACSDAPAVTVSPTFGTHPTIGIGGDGLPLAAGNSGGNVTLVHCNDADCSSWGPVFFGEPPNEGALLILESRDPVLGRTPDGRGVLAYSLRTTTAISQSLAVRVRTCTDAACSSMTGVGGVTVAALQSMSGLPASVAPALAIGPDGLPILSSTQPLNGTRLNVGECSVPSCLSTVGVDVDGPGAGRFSSVALSPAGLGLVAYEADAGGGSLRTIYLDTIPTADLAVTMSVSPDPAGADQDVDIRAQVQNLGPGLARGNQVTHTLPPGVVYEFGSGCQVLSPGSVRCTLNDFLPGPIPPESLVRVHVPPGVTGPLVASATVSTSSNDPVSANNTASISFGTLPSLRISSPEVLEGDAGLRQGHVEVELVDDGSHPPSVTASYTIGGGSAQPGTDYVQASGNLTFTPGATVSVTVSVVGDLVSEFNENFFLQLTPAGAVPTQDDGVTILDDDLTVTVQGELAHGTTVVTSLEGTAPEDRYSIEEPATASFEIVADAVSGDVQPLSIRLFNSTHALLDSGTPSTLGGSVRLTYFTGDVPNLTHYVRVNSGGCTTCGPDDTYRLRAYETTGRIARFNNTGDQATVLIVQNPTDETANALAYFWSSSGVRLGFHEFSLPAHGVGVLSTPQVVPGQSGSITILHTLPYGALLGKAVALEPATGFSFDSPMTYRPK